MPRGKPKLDAVGYFLIALASAIFIAAVSVISWYYATRKPKPTEAAPKRMRVLAADSPHHLRQTIDSLDHTTRMASI